MNIIQNKKGGFSMRFKAYEIINNSNIISFSFIMIQNI